LEGAEPGTSATLNFKDKKPRVLEGRQSYPIDVYADGKYVGVLNPGETIKTPPASTIVELPAKEKTFKAQEGAVVPTEDQDVWLYNDYIGYYQKNGSNIPHSDVPENIKTKLKNEYLEKTNQEKVNIKNQKIDNAISSLGEMVETSGFDGDYSKSFKIPQTKTGIETLTGLLTDPSAREKLGYGYMSESEVNDYLVKLNNAENNLDIWKQNISDEDYVNILNKENRS
jgi:hypothetical protein